jgi:hypothetical protein
MDKIKMIFHYNKIRWWGLDNSLLVLKIIIIVVLVVFRWEQELVIVKEIG